MLLALYIFVDDDFDSPIYGDPEPEDLDEGLHPLICEAANDALEGEIEPQGAVVVLDEVRLGWRTHTKLGITFVCAVTDDVTPVQVDQYLKALQKRYLDEVDDPREPEREGVADVVVDVIPPWEE